MRGFQAKPAGSCAGLRAPAGAEVETQRLSLAMQPCRDAKARALAGMALDAWSCTRVPGIPGCAVRHTAARQTHAARLMPAARPPKSHEKSSMEGAGFCAGPECGPAGGRAAAKPMPEPDRRHLGVQGEGETGSGSCQVEEGP